MFVFKCKYRPEQKVWVDAVTLGRSGNMKEGIMPAWIDLISITAYGGEPFARYDIRFCQSVDEDEYCDADNMSLNENEIYATKAEALMEINRAGKE